jgi:hypothetical protein
MDLQRALKNGDKDCESAEPPEVFLGVWLTRGLKKYLDCRTQSVSGVRTLVWVSEVTEMPQVTDRFSAKDMVFEIAGGMTEGRITLPDARVRVFFHNCRHSFAHLAGCFAGSDARGHLDYTKADDVSGFLDIDVRFYTDARMHQGGIDRLPAAQLSFSFAKRVPVGKPKSDK